MVIIDYNHTGNSMTFRTKTRPR